MPRASGGTTSNDRREDVGVVQPLKNPQNVSATISVPTDAVRPQTTTNGAPPSMPIACTAMRPRGDRRRQASASQPPTGAPAMLASWTKIVAVRPGHRQPHVEPIEEELRHPRQQDDRDEVRAHERAEQTEQRRRAPDQPQEGAEAERRRRLGACAAPSRRSSPARRLAPRGGSIEEPVEHESEQHAQAAEDDERQPPAVGFGDQPGEKPAADRAHVDRRLMKAQRARARRLP